MFHQSNRLVNTCRWSSSRENTFTECRKKYWYTYYGSWEGWPKTPFDSRDAISPLSSILYSLKNMQMLAVFTGSIVHKVIENALKEFLSNRVPPKPGSLIQETRRLFQKGLFESKEEMWKKHPKKYVRIAEHYFGLPLSETEEKEAEEKAVCCINAWEESPCVTNLIFHPKAQALGTEASHTFSLKEGVEAIVVYDFYLKWPKSDGSSTLIIFDWKTGKENEKIEEQLLAYALAAQELFKIPLASLILTPFYLSEGPNAYKKYGLNQAHPLDESRLEAARSRFTAAALEMLTCHPKEPYTCPDPQLFLATEDKRKCRRCCYQEICLKAEYKNVSLEELERLFTTN